MQDVEQPGFDPVLVVGPEDRLMSRQDKGSRLDFLPVFKQANQQVPERHPKLLPAGNGLPPSARIARMIEKYRARLEFVPPILAAALRHPSCVSVQ